MKINRTTHTSLLLSNPLKYSALNPSWVIPPRPSSFKFCFVILPIYCLNRAVYRAQPTCFPLPPHHTRTNSLSTNAILWFSTFLSHFQFLLVSTLAPATRSTSNSAKNDRIAAATSTGGMLMTSRDLSDGVKVLLYPFFFFVVSVPVTVRFLQTGWGVSAGGMPGGGVHGRRQRR